MKLSDLDFDSTKRIIRMLEDLAPSFDWVARCEELSNYNPNLFDTLINNQIVDHYRQDTKLLTRAGENHRKPDLLQQRNQHWQTDK